MGDRAIKRKMENIIIQNELRMLYNSTRRKTGMAFKDEEEALYYCIERLLGECPSFILRFDRGFFKNNTLLKKRRVTHKNFYTFY